MKAFTSLFFVALVVVVTSGNEYQLYQDLAVQVLRKANDANFFKRNAGAIASLVPPIQQDTQRFLNKNSRTLSSISKKLLPKVQNCNGDFDRLGKDAIKLCTPLLLTDGAAATKLIKNGKSALRSMDKSQLIENCLALAPRLQ